MTRLQQLYQEQLRPKLKEEFGLSTVMQVPRIEKITLNMGLGIHALNDKKVIASALEELTQIAGQKAIICTARKSVASFKIREGAPIGCKVTLRGKRMYEFLDRLVNICLPRVRDFRGLSKKSFDGRGNYNLGIKEQIVFPEVNVEKADTIRGLDIAISITGKDNDKSYQLLKAMNFPFKD